MTDKTINLEYPVPVVRLILTDIQGKALILKRIDSLYGDGCWCLPGGKVDYGQTVAETVINELQEETGLLCTFMEFFILPGQLVCKTR